jgi:hypothetical protein
MARRPRPGRRPGRRLQEPRCAPGRAPAAPAAAPATGRGHRSDSDGVGVRPGADATLERAHGVGRQPRPLGQLLLRQRCGFARRPQRPTEGRPHPCCCTS